MFSKQQLEALWDNAPINNFLNFSALNRSELLNTGVVVTEDWARALYLFERYSGGGYLSAAAGVTCIWRFFNGRYNVPYGNQIGNLFYLELLYTYQGNRDVPSLLGRVLQVINSPLSSNSELALIFSVIKEKTGVDHEKILQKSSPAPQKVTADKRTPNKSTSFTAQ